VAAIVMIDGPMKTTVKQESIPLSGDKINSQATDMPVGKISLTGTVYRKP
jgi:hypothetical protein